jgi:hypothetical protein
MHLFFLVDQGIIYLTRLFISFSLSLSLSLSLTSFVFQKKRKKMDTDKLKLQISVGSSYDSEQQQIVLPNNDSHPYFINTSHFTGRICIRIKDFKGITPPDCKTRIESSPYFEGCDINYSIQVQGRFKGNNLTADDIVFGVKKKIFCLQFSNIIYDHKRSVY